MGKIIVLDEHTANKIAAGEVVERPASVIKELVENSIDAGATLIEVAIKGGGLTSISVSDNGSGMDSQDALLAFERHATSKLTNADDLDGIATLGFRGEALPSIAAVSKIRLSTRSEGNNAGIQIIIEGGKILHSGETGCPKGTYIEVNDLFYNTPARQKHLKNPTSEAGHVSDIISRIAMGYPGISFQLKNEGRIALKTPGNGNLLDCVASIYGTDLAKELLKVEYNTDLISISGFIGKPFVSRSTRNHQSVYINGRYVKDKIISDAVESAYHSMLMVGRHSVFILKINTNPKLVDVNVHPAKTKVRLAEPDEIEYHIRKSVKDTLTSHRLIPDTDLTNNKPVKSLPDTGTDKKIEKGMGTDTASATQEVIEQFSVQTFKPATTFNLSEKPKYNIEKESYDNRRSENIHDYVRETNEYHNMNDTKTSASTFPELRTIGQIDNTYIVAEGLDGMYLIDQHAAHERILYETFMSREQDYIAAEQLLFPETIQLTNQETQILVDNINKLANLGFVLEHFGGNSFLLRAVPAGLPKPGGKETFLDLLDYFSQNRYTITDKTLKEKLLITMSCKNAIKAHDRLTQPEMEALISNLAKLKQPYTCPHGRPTIIHFTIYELEKMFKRVI